MILSIGRRRAALGLAVLGAMAGSEALQGARSMAWVSRTLEEKSVSEPILKAEIVERFSRFVRWPDEALPPDGSPFVLCVTGSSPLRQTLPEAAEGQTVAEHPTKVVLVEDPFKLDSCHLLFVGRLEIGALEATLEAVRGEPILTVADSQELSEAGVMINLVSEEGRIGFEVNEASAAESRLELTAALLRLAKSVGVEEPGS